MLPIALQLSPLGGELVKDFDGTVAKVKEMGYDGVEFAGFFRKDAAYARKVCDDNGLKIISNHTLFEDLYYDTDKRKRIFDDCKTIGADYLVVAYLMEDCRPGVGDFAKFVNGMKELGRQALDNGITLCYHNHSFEFEIEVEGKYLYDMIFDNISIELLKPQPDLAWIAVGCEDPVKYMKKYNGNIPTVHLKDFYSEELLLREPKKGIRPDFRPVGYGMLDVADVIRTATKCGTKWLIVEQDEKSVMRPDLTYMDNVRMSIDYIRSLG